MDFKKIVKWLLLIAVVFCGVQFSLAYVNFRQISHIMEAEALDARRMRTGEEELLKRIRDRARGSGVDIPEDEDIAFDVEGLNERDQDLVITAEYVEEVNLLVHVIRWPRTIVAIAEAPERD